MRTQDVPQRIGRTTNVLRRTVWNVDSRKKHCGLRSQNKSNGLEWQLVAKEQKESKDKEEEETGRRMRRGRRKKRRRRRRKVRVNTL